MWMAPHATHPVNPDIWKTPRLHDGVAPRDVGGGPEVPVLERRPFPLPCNAFRDHSTDVVTALHGDLGDTGQVLVRHHVAGHEHVGMAGHREV